MALERCTVNKEALKYECCFSLVDIASDTSTMLNESERVSYRLAYFSSFRSDAPSAVVSVVDDVACRFEYDTARMSLTVTSQAVHFVSLPKRYLRQSIWTLSVLPQETSLTAATLKRPRARYTRSFKTWLRVVLPELRLQARPWVPSGPTSAKNIEEAWFKSRRDMLHKLQIFIKDDTKITSRINRWEYDIVR